MPEQIVATNGYVRDWPVEWDDGKRAANLARHGVDFIDALRFDWDNAQLTPDTRRDYGELRVIAVGRIGRRMHVLVFAPRAEAIRIISRRKANDREIRRYEENKAETEGKVHDG
jgi:uncharacterized DUF497 family protein